MVAFDYTTQQWVEGRAASEVALQQERATLALLQSPAGVDYAKFINRDHGVAIAEARRSVLELEAGGGMIMERITIKDLTALLGIMARELGTPEGPAYTRKDGHNVATVGKLLIQPGSSTYGNAWALCQIMNEGGGERSILRGGSARELFTLMHAYRAGYAAAKRGEV